MHPPATSCTETDGQQLGFVIPLGANPQQCYNEITPNDMYTSLACAFSGAFLISGGLSMAVWSMCLLETAVQNPANNGIVFIRALSMLHLGRNSSTGHKAWAGLWLPLFSQLL
jgi:hypothetical protein